MSPIRYGTHFVRLAGRKKFGESKNPQPIGYGLGVRCINAAASACRLSLPILYGLGIRCINAAASAYRLSLRGSNCVQAQSAR